MLPITISADTVWQMKESSWQSGCRLHLIPRTVSLGRVHLGLSMLLLSSVCVLLPIHDV